LFEKKVTKKTSRLHLLLYLHSSHQEKNEARRLPGWISSLLRRSYSLKRLNALTSFVWTASAFYAHTTFSRLTRLA